MFFQIFQKKWLVLINHNARDKAKDLHLDADKYLREGNSYIFFEELDDLIFTGVTGSNVSDIMLTLVE